MTTLLKFQFRDGQYFIVNMGDTEARKVVHDFANGNKRLWNITAEQPWAVNTEHLMFVHPIDPATLQQVQQQQQ